MLNNKELLKALKLYNISITVSVTNLVLIYMLTTLVNSNMKAIFNLLQINQFQGYMAAILNIILQYFSHIPIVFIISFKATKNLLF